MANCGGILIRNVRALSLRSFTCRFRSTEAKEEKLGSSQDMKYRDNVTSKTGRRIASDIKEKDFCLKKVLLVRKVTRYEYEKFHLKPDLTEDQLERHVRSKGSDYDALVKRHEEYYRSLDEIKSHLSKRGIEYSLIHRYEYSKSLIENVDVVITAGGDGTFLMTASKVDGLSTPIIGINTDPLRSEGFLCLPKQYSKNLGDALDRILDCKFRWYWRQRIRLTMTGHPSNETPIDLHNEQLLFPEHRFWEHVKENEIHQDNSSAAAATVKYSAATDTSTAAKTDTKAVPNTADEGTTQCETVRRRVLPILALNEVFIGETLSARVSFYELSIDGSARQKQKSSGVMICPGTGSTSWFFNVGNISKPTATEILRIAQKYHGCSNAKLQDDYVLQQIVNEYNSALVFSPSEMKMAFCVRDPLTTGIFQATQPRGFCNKMWIKSRMYDASVVIDGSLSYRFNHGAALEMDMQESDALRCVMLD